MPTQPVPSRVVEVAVLWHRGQPHIQNGPEQQSGGVHEGGTGRAEVRLQQRRRSDNADARRGVRRPRRPLRRETETRN